MNMDSPVGDSTGVKRPWIASNPPMANSENAEEVVVHTFLSTIKPMAVTGPLNILLFCMPIAIISFYAKWPSTVTFIFSLLALAPLAERLGFVTEQLAMHTNETIGGLLNASFGNATELIVAITALKRGLYKLVQLSLLGSILSNMLLVLGCAFFFGGLVEKTQHFGTISSQMNSTLLILSTMGILFPTILSNTSEESRLGELGFSRATALILFLLYFAFLYFQVLRLLGIKTSVYDSYALF
jgi:Ca2+:H+ antiporter